MIKRLDKISMISVNKVNPELQRSKLNQLFLSVKNLRKYRIKIEKRKEKIKRLYDYE
jgi:hypothetical protein